MKRKSIFVVGADAPNMERLRRLPQAKECDFLAALELDEIRGVESFDVPALTEKAASRMAEHHGSVDGVVAFYDFPASTILPILVDRFALPGPRLESVLKCEHKYWGRLEQLEVAPDHVPQFRAFDPCAVHRRGDMPLSPPFWIKPVKSFRSYLGFLVNDERDFRAYSDEICRHVDYIIAPFREMLRAHHMPAEIADMDETCLAESLISGAQCTLEGYVYQGEVVLYGIVDSVRAADRSSFSRYQYPSSLPQTVQHRMANITRRVIERIALDNACFDIEYFWDQATDNIWLLEINPRLSQSHGEIFELVHGVSHQTHMVDIALGRKPQPLPNDGPYEMAANCHLRAFEDSRVQRVPDKDELRRISERIPGVTVRLYVEQGQTLSELENQDSYSFEVGSIFVGGRDELDILEKYDSALEQLGLELAPLRSDALAPEGTPVTGH
ncbi:ATP-grasp domain-containing protein [Aquisalimonas sp.]|uniref:ATP-grasp domain-containing protein n=1 Tax=Aquisalimonas sp. TaxID=1872621 RepID=UPI0025B97443|nr:ATP-grasp domain-containing protein [Aquisalimonas sp.]